MIYILIFEKPKITKKIQPDPYSTHQYRLFRLHYSILLPLNFLWLILLSILEKHRNLEDFHQMFSFVYFEKHRNLEDFHQMFSFVGFVVFVVVVSEFF